MPTTEKPTIGFGTLLGYREVGAVPGLLIPLANLLKVAPSKMKVADIDTTNADSPAELDGTVWEESMPSAKKSPGEVSATLQYKKTMHVTVLGLFGVMKNWVVTYKDTSTRACDGYINEVGETVSEGGVNDTEVKIKWSGKPVFTPATPAV